MKWRKWNNIIHRDLGYLCVGLTIVYAVSGIAVNHAGDWNPNYIVENKRAHIEPIPENKAVTMATVTKILNRLGEKRQYKSHFRPDPETLQIFVEGNTISVNLATGDVLQESVRNRPVLREMNFLHLNHPKKLWTWFADLYALSLALLAITGMFVIKGRKGIKGRGKWWVAAGVILPVLFLWLYF